MAPVSLENSRQLLRPASLPRSAPTGERRAAAAIRRRGTKSTEAISTAMTPNTAVPAMPHACTAVTASRGPSTYPPLPPTEKILSPVP